MFSSTLVALALPLLASAAPFTKRASNRATYYDTSVGLGACGAYHSNDEYTVALNSAQFGSGYPGPHCGDSIWITYNGKTVSATVQDECPTCPSAGGLDLSEGLFSALADKSVGVIYMDWGFGSSGGNTAEATSTYVAPTSTYVAPTSTYVAPTSTSSAAATQTETASTEETCPDEFILYNGDATLYDQKFIVKNDLVLLYNWASKESLVNLLANTTSYCLNGTTEDWDSTSDASSLLGFFDF